MNDGMTIDDAVFNARMSDLAQALIEHGGDAQTIVADESRLFAKAAVKFTAPDTKAQGEGAIKKDLLKIFSPVEDFFAEHVAQEYGTDQIRHWITGRQGDRYEVQWDKLDVHGYGMATFHAQHRNSRGRTVGERQKRSGGVWKARYVVSDSAFQTYYKRVIEKVGSLKSGWAVALVSLGGKVPAWVARQLQKHLGSVRDDLFKSEHPSVSMTNRAEGVENTREKIHEIFRIRRNAIILRTKRIARGYANDVAMKRKIVRKEAMTLD